MYPLAAKFPSIQLSIATPLKFPVLFTIKSSPSRENLDLASLSHLLLYRTWEFPDEWHCLANQRHPWATSVCTYGVSSSLVSNDITLGTCNTFESLPSILPFKLPRLPPLFMDPIKSFFDSCLRWECHCFELFCILPVYFHGPAERE